MSDTHTLTKEEKFKIMELYRKLMAEGKTEEAVKVAMKIPLAPHLAMALKEVCGVDYVRTSGFDLSKADNTYGKDWLNK